MKITRTMPIKSTEMTHYGNSSMERLKTLKIHRSSKHRRRSIDTLEINFLKMVTKTASSRKRWTIIFRLIALNGRKMPKRDKSDHQKNLLMTKTWNAFPTRRWSRSLLCLIRSVHRSNILEVAYRKKANSISPRKDSYQLIFDFRPSKHENLTPIK